MLSILLLLLSPIVSQRTFTVPVAITTDGDTIYVDVNRIWNSTGTIDIKGFDDAYLDEACFFDDEGASDISTHDLAYPIGHYRDGKTYVTFFGKFANYYVLEYDHANSQWNHRFSYCQDGGYDDSHNTPTIFKDTAGYVHLFVGHHDYKTYHYRSAVDNIASYSKINDVSILATYPQTHEVGDSLIQFFREYTGGIRPWVIRTSSDYGSTWSESDTLFRSTAGANVWYITSFEKNDTIHFAAAGDDAGNRRNVYYAYMTPAGDLKNISGTTLSKPITHAIADASCLVYDSGTHMIYTPHVSVDANGNPYLLFDEQVDGWTYKSARWTGSEWDVNTLVSGSGYNSSNAINAVSENQIEAYIITDYFDISSGDYVFGGTLERWISADTAKTWARDRIILSGANVNGVSVIKDCCEEAKVIFSTCTYGFRANNERIYLWGEKGFIKRNEGIAKNEITFCDDDSYSRIYQNGATTYWRGDDDKNSDEKTFIEINTATGDVTIPNLVLEQDSSWKSIEVDFINPKDSIFITFPAGEWAVDQFVPATNDSSTSYIGTNTNPYGSGYYMDFYALKKAIIKDSVKAFDDNGLGIYDNDGNLGIFIEDGGNVGINTSTPNAKLEVDGDVIIDSNLTVEDTLSAPEQWVMEERVDTVYITEMKSYGYGAAFIFSSNEGTEEVSAYIHLNADGEFWWYNLAEKITADSIEMDSINWELNIFASNADTIYLGYIDAIGSNCTMISCYTTDTIIKNSNTGCWDTTVVFNKSMNKSNMGRYSPYVNLFETSDRCLVTQLILYYAALNKRYGIPE
jgi:hypothetical protein